MNETLYYHNITFIRFIISIQWRVAPERAQASLSMTRAVSNATTHLPISHVSTSRRSRRRDWTSIKWDNFHRFITIQGHCSICGYGNDNQKKKDYSPSASKIHGWVPLLMCLCGDQD